MVLKDNFWRMNSWRRGWPKAPLAPMMRTEIDMTRKMWLRMDCYENGCRKRTSYNGVLCP
jgi:hypothetical protein